METLDLTLDCGACYKANIHHDADMGMPWDEHPGHGEIRTVRKPYAYPEATGKNPGEVVIHDDRHTLWLYNFAEAVSTAIKEGWGPRVKGLSGGQNAVNAVKADMKYCTDFLTGNRWFIWVEVYPVDSDGEQIGTDTATLGGIEAGNSAEAIRYMLDALNELAQGLQDTREAEAREAEAREALAWAARDVVTGNPAAPAAYFIEG